MIKFQLIFHKFNSLSQSLAALYHKLDFLSHNLDLSHDFLFQNFASLSHNFHHFTSQILILISYSALYYVIDVLSHNCNFWSLSFWFFAFHSHVNSSFYNLNFYVRHYFILKFSIYPCTYDSLIFFPFYLIFSTFIPQFCLFVS